MNHTPPISPIRLIPEPSITPTDDQRIKDSLCICFPDDAAAFSQSRAWHDSSPAYSVVIDLDDRIIAHVGVVDRNITIGQSPLRAAGIQNVMVLPQFRGRGLVDQVMHAAMNHAHNLGFDLGLLFCVPPLQPVYRRCGWVTLSDRPVIRIDRDRECPLPGKNIIMAHPFSPAPIPDGIIHLRGNDW